MIVRTADKLYHIRQRAGLTQEQLAEIMGVSKQAISKWESGKSNPELEKLKRFAERFQVSLDDLLNESVGLDELFIKNETEPQASELPGASEVRADAPSGNGRNKRILFFSILALILVVAVVIVVLWTGKPGVPQNAEDPDDASASNENAEQEMEEGVWEYPDENRNIVRSATGEAVFTITKEQLSEQINEHFGGVVFRPDGWIYCEDLCTDEINVYLYGGEEYTAANQVWIYAYENRSSRLLDSVSLFTDTKNYSESEEQTRKFREYAAVLATAVLDVDFKTATESIGNVFNSQTGIAWRNAVITYTWEEPVLQILYGMAL